ncbi:beta-lactamase regulating signal transducer with metallopeptidase domain [Anaerotaenia torta]|uniref:M56 family metallopeptidase n=1 Tax=Anaerotaenia torta TaxID=433293 RepID=UPI003D257DAB
MSSRQELFTTVLNMSITASYVAAGIILVRILLKKAPKIFSYAIWAVLLFRLICPFSFSTSFSFLGLLNVKSQNSMGVLEYISHDIGAVQAPIKQNDINGSGINGSDIGGSDGSGSDINGSNVGDSNSSGSDLSSADVRGSDISNLDSAAGIGASLLRSIRTAKANFIQIWMDVLSIIWLTGIAVLFSVSIILYIKIKRRLLTATLVNDNIYESDRIGTALVCGFLHPKIYVPLGVEEPDLSYILEHERTHIRRRDYLIKPLAFFALLLHWFNPLMWLSFALMSRDMEMSCDESVLQRMGRDARGGGFLVVAPKIYGSYEEEDRLKVFATTYQKKYKLFGNEISEGEYGSIIPAAITYRKDDNGDYILEEYRQAEDGAGFVPSIEEYCTMPVSGKKIEELADTILEDYPGGEDIQALMQDNLRKHLKKHGVEEVEIAME